ncbi:hypothetical protein [Candidatus Binatus sp.]|uniref:hypothetical protein n=1 Tax=Candidatus Binatus sp. TaxID=2811406 RepID=UPI003C81430B
MKFKKTFITGVLAGAMLALPMTMPAFAEPALSANSNNIERVHWWHHDYDDYGYRNRGYYGNGYYGNRYYGGYRQGYGACANAQRLQNQARRDYWTGHPAAASDVGQQAAWARSHCY